MEDMDVTDRNFRPCKCGYQICLFCYRHIKDDLNGLCPACRTPYDEANVSFVTPDPQECALASSAGSLRHLLTDILASCRMARVAREKKAKELKDKKEQQAKDAKEKREQEPRSRQEAHARSSSSAPAAVFCSAGVAPSGRPVTPAAAVVAGAINGPTSNANGGNSVRGVSSAASRSLLAAQALGRQESMARDVAPPRSSRSVVHVIGLSPRIAKEDVLRRHEYFGQYGKILRVQVTGAATACATGPVSMRSTITFSSREEAEQAVLAVDNVVLDGRTLKASFGTGPSKVRVCVRPMPLLDSPRVFIRFFRFASICLCCASLRLPPRFRAG